MKFDPDKLIFSLEIMHKYYPTEVKYKVYSARNMIEHEFFHKMLRNHGEELSVQERMIELCQQYFEKQKIDGEILVICSDGDYFYADIEDIGHLSENVSCYVNILMRVKQIVWLYIHHYPEEEENGMVD